MFQIASHLLSPKEGWCRIKWNLYAKGERPEERASSWGEGLRSLLDGDWAVAESQRGMTQHEVKSVCQGATPWKTGIFLRGRFELFTRGWVICCWGEWSVAELVLIRITQRMRRMTSRHEGNRKGKYKHLV